MDPRKGYLLQCIKSLLNLEEEPKGLATKSPILDDFINTIEQTSLQLVYIPNKGFKPYKFCENLPPESQIISIIKNSTEFIS